MRWPFQNAEWLNMKEETLEEIGQEMPQFLLYESRGRGEREWQCISCGQRGIDKIPGKSGETVRCPGCGERAELKCSGRLKNDAPTLRRRMNVLYFTAREQGGPLWAVGCEIHRSLYRNSWEGVDWLTEMDVIPYRVWRFDPEGEKAEEWANRWDGWHGPITAREPTSGTYQEMEHNLRQTEELERTSMKYCRAVAPRLWGYSLEEGNQVTSPITYLRAFAQRPKVELVWKWGITDAAKDWVWSRKSNGRIVNWRANTPWEFLKISKGDWGLYRKSRRASVALLGANRRSFHLSIKELMEIAERMSGEGWIEKAEKLTRLGIGLKEQVKYLEKQTGAGAGMGVRLIHWLDYLDMAREAGRDMEQKSTRMPRDLAEAHQGMVEYRRARAQEEQARVLAAEYQEYGKRRAALKQKYEYHSQGLTIRVPEDGGEIIREGNVLHICVGGYAGRHLAGKTTILFLRRERRPDRPYICIELEERNNRIRQIHGYKNEYLGPGKRARDPAERFRPFLEEWLDWVKAGSHRKNEEKRKDGIA